MKTKLQGIGILGSGAWGTALACSLNRKGNITLWSYEKQTVKQINKYRINKIFLPKIKIPNNVTATNNLEDLKSCKFIFICIPSQFINKIILKFKKIYKKSALAQKNFADVGELFQKSGFAVRIDRRRRE